MGAWTREGAGFSHQLNKTLFLALMYATALLNDAVAVGISLEIRRSPTLKGQRVELKCKANSATSIKWNFGHNTIATSPSTVHVIHAADLSDSGTYACEAKVGGSWKTSNEEMLVVYTIPKFSRLPQNESAHVGQNVTFSTEVSNFYGMVKVQPQWRNEQFDVLNKDDEPVSGSATGKMTLTYILNNVTLADSMTYYFLFTSSNWSPPLMAKFRLTVEQVFIIIPPNNLIFPDEFVTNSSVILTWSFLSGSTPIGHFLFFYKNFNITANSKNRSIILTGLESCKSYSVYGISVGLNGKESQRSDVVSVTTRPTLIDSKQVWVDGSKIVLCHNGLCLPLCIRTTLTDREVKQACDLVAQLPQNVTSHGGKNQSMAFETELTFSEKPPSSFAGLIQSCLHKTFCSTSDLEALTKQCYFTPTPSAFTDTPSTSSSEKEGLTVGAIVGISIFVAVVVIIAIGILSWCFRRIRRKPFRPDAENVQNPEESSDGCRMGALVPDPNQNDSEPCKAEYDSPKFETTPKQKESAPIKVIVTDDDRQQAASTEEVDLKATATKSRPRSLSYFIRQLSTGGGQSYSPLVSDEKEFEADFQSSKKVSPKSLRSTSFPNQTTNPYPGDGTGGLMDDTSQPEYVLQTMENYKSLQNQLFELSDQRHEDHQETLAALNRFTKTQQTLLDIITQSRTPSSPNIALFKKGHVRRGSAPPQMSELPDAASNFKPFGILEMPPAPKFELGFGAGGRKGSDRRDSNSSVSSTAGIKVPLGEVQKLRKQMDDVRQRVDAIFSAVVEMKSKVAVKDDTKSIQREADEIRAGLESVATMMIENASVSSLATVFKEPILEDSGK